MTKMKASLSPVLVSAMLLACSSKTSPQPPIPDGDANETRTDTNVASDGGESHTDTGAKSDGKCPQGAYAHEDGLCYCQADKPNVCGDVCVDSMTDPDHCGDCATKDGPMQGCNAGHCSAAPTTLIPAAAGCGALHLAWAGGTLYWTDRDHGTVKGLSTTGG